MIVLSLHMIFYHHVSANSAHAGKGDENRLVVEDVTKRCRIISLTHDASHFGVNRTVDVLSNKYYWPGLTKDVRLYVSNNYLEAR